MRVELAEWTSAILWISIHKRLTKSFRRVVLHQFASTRVQKAIVESLSICDLRRSLQELCQRALYTCLYAGHCGKVVPVDVADHVVNVHVHLRLGDHREAETACVEEQEQIQKVRIAILYVAPLLRADR